MIEEQRRIARSWHDHNGGLTLYLTYHDEGAGSVYRVENMSVATAYVLRRGTPTIGTPNVTPRIVEAHRTSVVTVSVQIADPKFTVYGVHLVAIDRHGTVLPDREIRDEDGRNDDALPGHQFFLRMRDDGTKGDAVAHDGVFTRRVMLTNPVEPVYFELHASFDEIAQPVRSEPVVIDVRR